MKCDRFASMLLILCMVLAGCTGPAAPEAGATAAEQPAPEATAAKEAELVTMLVFPPDDVALYAEAFTEQTQVEIEFAEPSNAAFEQMLTDFAAGKSTYDIVGVDNALGSLYTMDSLLDQGYFLPLTDAPNVGKAVGAMLPVLQELVTREGHGLRPAAFRALQAAGIQWAALSGRGGRPAGAVQPQLLSAGDEDAGGESPAAARVRFLGGAAFVRLSGREERRPCL